MPSGFLTVLPVYNEAAHVAAVLNRVLRYAHDVLVVDDGSTDDTSRFVRRFPGVRTLRHESNLGYGAALTSGFRYAAQRGYALVVTIDCDGQHEPARIPRFVEAAARCDIVSGSRYLRRYPGDSEPPPERRRVNELVTAELNRRLGLQLTDAFCGFKAYRVEALERLTLTEPGYAMPLELWVQAAHAGLRIVELPVPLIYLDEERSFGGALDDAWTRLEYYHLVLDRSLAVLQPASGTVWSGALCREAAG